jgi:hypothetical protein
MSLGDRCHACRARQSLSEVKGPELMDREGHTEGTPAGFDRCHLW